MVIEREVLPKGNNKNSTGGILSFGEGVRLACCEKKYDVFQIADNH